jgi:hypothetical protein
MEKRPRGKELVPRGLRETCLFHGRLCMPRGPPLDWLGPARNGPPCRPGRGHESAERSIRPSEGASHGAPAQGKEVSR